jgi:4a-hydroxytetrahydrobiopterin dehydratase
MIGALNKDWELVYKEDKEYLEKTFSFADFDASIAFVNKVAAIAKAQDHHPTISIDWSKVTIKTTTHSAEYRVTEKDEKLALGIEEVL